MSFLTFASIFVAIICLNGLIYDVAKLKTGKKDWFTEKMIENVKIVKSQLWN